MKLRILTAVLGAAFLASATIHPAVAQDKKLTPQQQKMKVCAGKWKDEKKAKGVSGRVEYQKFMKGCLKS